MVGRHPTPTAVNHPFILQSTRTIFNAFVGHLTAHQLLSYSRLGDHVCPPASLTLTRRESTSSSCKFNAITIQKRSKSCTFKNGAPLSSPNRSVASKGMCKAEDVDITPDSKGLSSPCQPLCDHFPSLAPLSYHNDKRARFSGPTPHIAFQHFFRHSYLVFTHRQLKFIASSDKSRSLPNVRALPPTAASNP